MAEDVRNSMLETPLYSFIVKGWRNWSRGLVSVQATEEDFLLYLVWALDTIKELLKVDTESWLADIQNIKEFYAQVGDRVPDAMYDELAALEARLSK